MEPDTGRPTPTFRQEALAHRGRREERGEIVDLAPRWTRWVFYVVLALVAAAVVATSVVEIDRYATGVSGTKGSIVVVVLPAALAPEVEVGSPVSFGEATARVTRFGNEVLDPSEVRDRFGVDVTLPSVVVETSAARRDAAEGTPRVLIESEPIIVALVPGLKALFQGSDA